MSGGGVSSGPAACQAGSTNSAQFLVPDGISSVTYYPTVKQGGLVARSSSLLRQHCRDLLGHPLRIARVLRVHPGERLQNRYDDITTGRWQPPWGSYPVHQTDGGARQTIVVQTLFEINGEILDLAFEPFPALAVCPMLIVVPQPATASNMAAPTEATTILKFTVTPCRDIPVLPQYTAAGRGRFIWSRRLVFTFRTCAERPPARCQVIRPGTAGSWISNKIPPGSEQDHLVARVVAHGHVHDVADELDPLARKSSTVCSISSISKPIRAMPYWWSDPSVTSSSDEDDRLDQFDDLTLADHQRELDHHTGRPEYPVQEFAVPVLVARDQLETEHVAVERDVAVEIADQQQRVVHVPDHHSAPSTGVSEDSRTAMPALLSSARDRVLRRLGSRSPHRRAFAR